MRNRPGFLSRWRDASPRAVACLRARNAGHFQTVRRFFSWGGFCFNAQTCVPAHGRAGRAVHLPPQQIAPLYMDTHTHTLCSQRGPRGSDTGVCVLQETWVPLSHPCDGDGHLRGSRLQGIRTQSWLSLCRYVDTKTCSFLGCIPLAVPGELHHLYLYFGYIAQGKLSLSH